MKLCDGSVKSMLIFLNWSLTLKKKKSGGDLNISAIWSKWFLCDTRPEPDNIPLTTVQSVSPSHEIAKFNKTK